MEIKILKAPSHLWSMTTAFSFKKAKRPCAVGNTCNANNDKIDCLYISSMQLKPKIYIDNLDGIITELFTDTGSDNNDYLNKLVHPELNRLTVNM